ncbi:DUF1934 domain-containing protein [Salirhabdus salicampi]|uniref:DUF1934 domain-containing protein n=1 Tax=Salirhabdus salicampi TaxID=476102 RepID=UPI0020C3A51F|nr:DUF1934 domain-containing protein [Salirhabdus salicampi]
MAEQKQVNVKVTSMISESGHKETIEVEEQGRYYQKGDTHILIFDEKDDEDNVTHNFFTINEEKVVLKRSGQMRMNQMFRLGQTTENPYQHPYGTMLMKTKTKQLQFDTSEDQTKGQLQIDYELSLSEQPVRQHRLTITYEEV